MATVKLSREFEAVVVKAIRPKLVKLAKTIEDDMHRLVPIDTGDLDTTIHVDVLKDGTIEGHAGSESVDYASHVEFGTHASPLRPWDTPAQPYIRPAFYENRGEL